METKKKTTTKAKRRIKKGTEMSIQNSIRAFSGHNHFPVHEEIVSRQKQDCPKKSEKTSAEEVPILDLEYFGAELTDEQVQANWALRPDLTFDDFAGSF